MLEPLIVNTDTLGSLKCVVIREMFSFQGENSSMRLGFNWSSVLTPDWGLRCPLHSVLSPVSLNSY